VRLVNQLPVDVYGKRRTDRFFRGLTAFRDAYMGAVYRRADRTAVRPPPEVPAWRELVVDSRTAVCDEVISLRLTAVGGDRLPRWRPGAHLRITLPSGRVRHYSLCGADNDRDAYTIAVRRIPGGGGGGSAEIHESVLPGSLLRAVGPRNGFWFGAEPAVLFIAGGIGITPLLPMAREAAARGLDWWLVYTGRSRACMPFVTSVTELDPARTLILADDENGVPDCADLVSRGTPGAAVYCCGPPAMLDGVRRAAGERGFHFERFTPAPIANGQRFTLELARSGAVLEVPANRSALDVLRDLDPMTPYSCQQGFCGLCRQRVLDGQVEHRDLRLTDTERAAGDMLVCVSRARERETLVLDL
jgi:ferredoxin-NADP reductase